jgi:hypothetical protein
LNRVPIFPASTRFTLSSVSFYEYDPSLYKTLKG